MSNIDTLTHSTVFDQQIFDQVLIKIAGQAAETEQQPDGPVQEFEWLRACGALAIVLPGQLLDFNMPNTPALLKILKDIGKANLSVGRIYEGHINTLYLIHLYGTASQQAHWYRGVAEEGHLFGIWNTQAADGINFITEGGSLALKGSKTFCSGASLVNRALVTGNIDLPLKKGWQMCIIDMGRIPDQQIDRDSWKPLGMKASGSYKVDFSGYLLSDTELLAKPATYLTQPYFNGGAIRFAAVQLGGAEAIAQLTLDYLNELSRTDDTMQQMRISNMMTQLITGRLWLEQAGKHYDEWASAGTHNEELIAFANMTRVSIEEICLKIMDESNRCVGARGLMHPYTLERVYRDLTFYLRQPAPDATRANIAKFFIEHNQAFNG